MQIQFPSGLCIPIQPHTYVQFNKQFCFMRLSFIRYRSIFLTVDTKYRLEIVSTHYFIWLVLALHHFISHWRKFQTHVQSLVIRSFFHVDVWKKNMIQCWSVFCLVLDWYWFCFFFSHESQSVREFIGSSNIDNQQLRAFAIILNFNLFHCWRAIRRKKSERTNKQTNFYLWLLSRLYPYGSGSV